MNPVTLTQPLRLILEARHHDPFEVLGRHPTESGEQVTVFLPSAKDASIVVADESILSMQRIPDTDLFTWTGKAGIVPERYRIRWHDSEGTEHTDYDPYCFPPQVGEMDIYLYGEGKHLDAYRVFGAHPRVVDGIAGVLFVVWAPNAGRISVVGDFNGWDGRRHPMRVRGGSGVWELFIPGLGAGTLYKLELRQRDSGEVFLKADPYARAMEVRPDTACIVEAEGAYPWSDQAWMEGRGPEDWKTKPISVYEVHLGSWRRSEDGGFLNYRELGKRLVEYAGNLGFTHIQLMPVTEHPFDGSWGYQTLGYFAPTSRFGTPDDLRWLVDHCHHNGIGVLMDWVPAHFPKDPVGLARFDGTPLYEHADPRLGEHRDWDTLIFNFGRHEIKNFLIASALYWVDEFHLDGLRVDAVASMLYLDYSRNEGEWVPNKFGGRENLEAIEFLKEVNQLVQEHHPGTLMIAEESTDWPMVSRPTWLGGLGFTMKWNMGWMHDTLEYFAYDPIYRHYHHQLLTFGLLYAFTENFMLPFSHDEVVHMKRSMLEKMPGDDWQKFANLRLLYTYMYTQPGKKLLFMGGEFGQREEWNHDTALQWDLLEFAPHRGVSKVLADLNHLYKELPALHGYDFDARGFQWIDCNDSSQSVLAYLRRSEEDVMVVALNFTPVAREAYRIGVPRLGAYREVLNSDAEGYGGGNVGNAGMVQAEEVPWMDQPYSMLITLPPLAGVLFQPID